MSRSADVLAAAAESPPLPRAVRVAAQSPRGRRRAQSPCTARRHCSGRRASRRAVRRAGHRHSHRRHAAVGARALPARAGRHPDHDARVAVSAADVQRARGSELDRDGHHRRDPRARADQARGAPGRLARTPRRTLRASSATDRAVGHPASARRGGEVSWRDRDVTRRRRAARPGPPHHKPAAPKLGRDSIERRRERPALRRTEDRCRDRARVHGAPRHRPLSPRHHRRCRQKESTRADHRGAGRGHGEADDGGRHSERAGIGRRFASVNLVGDPPTAARADPRAPIDPHLRQQPPSGRTPGRRAQRAGRRNARALASRVDRAAAAGRGRGSVEGRSAPRAGRHLLARARHRHGRDRSRRPDRSAAVGRQRPAAHRSRRPSGQRDQRRRGIPEIPRGSGGVRRGRQGDARRRRRSHTLSAEPARHRRAAARRDGGNGRLACRRAVRDDPARRAVRGVEPHGVRRRARHAVRTLPIRRVRRTPPARDVGPRGGHRVRTRGREARGDRQRRNDSGSGALRRVSPWRRPGRRTRRRTGRGDGVREPRRRNVRARRVVVANRGDHTRSGHRLAGTRRAGQDAVLERRSSGPPARARPGDWPPDARSDSPFPARGARQADARARSRCAGGREPAAVPARSNGGDEGPSRRVDGGRRTRARRARRLAGVRPVAARRPGSRAMGDGGGGEDPRRDGDRRRDALGRRWVRRQVP